MSSFWQMTLANIRMTTRNRMALFWLMMFPLLFILMFGFFIPDGDFTLRLGIADGNSSPLTESITERMQEVDAFDVSLGEANDELAALSDGDRHVVVLFSEGGDEAQTSAELVYDQANMTVSQVGVGVIEQFLLEAEIQAIGAPRLIETATRGVDAEQFRFIDFMVPGILAMALMTNGVIALSSTFVSYRERGILRRLKATPFPLWAFILSKISVQVVVAMAQAAILLGVAALLFDVHISSSYLSLMLMVALGALAFLAIGFVVSAIARDSDTAGGISNVIVFPLLFLGGVFFPVDDAPSWMQPVLLVNPVTHMAEGLRDIILDGATIIDVWPSVIVMLVTALIAMIIAVRFFRWEARAT